jgi:hypothetical protein
VTWTAYLQDAVQRDGHWAYSIVYTDGTHKVLREYSADALDDAAVLAVARAEVARFSSASAPQSKFSLQMGQQLDLTPPATVTIQPSAADVAQSAWLSDWRLYRQLKSLADAGVTSLTLEPIASVQARLQKNWLDSYLAVI